MKKYDIKFINNIISSNNIILVDNIRQTIEEINNIVNSPMYNKTPHFLNKKLIKPNYKKLHEKDYELDKDNIRKYLNKISNNNYLKIKEELEKIINKINDNNHDNDILNNIANEIFTIFYNSKFNCYINSKLYTELFSKYDFINEVFHEYIKKTKYIYQDILICDTINFDEINRVNKNNDRLKSMIIFNFDCINYNLLDINLAYTYILHYQEVLKTNINIEFKKSFCEELTDIIIISINSIKNNLNQEIIDNINLIITYKINDFKSLSNKIILKHKNLLDKIILK